MHDDFESDGNPYDARIASEIESRSNCSAEIVTLVLLAICIIAFVYAATVYSRFERGAFGNDVMYMKSLQGRGLIVSACFWLLSAFAAIVGIAQHQNRFSYAVGLAVISPPAFLIGLVLYNSIAR